MAPPGYSSGSSSNLNYKPKVIHSSLAASLLGGGAGGSSGANRRGSPSSSPAAGGSNRFARSMQPTGAASRGSPDDSGPDAGRYDAAANGERAQRPSNQLSGLINGRSSGMLGAQRASNDSGSLMGLSGNNHHQSTSGSSSSSSSAAAAPAAKKQRVIVEDSDDTDASSPVKPSGAHFASYRYDPNAHKTSSSSSRPSAPSGAGSKRPRADEDEGQSRPSKASGREGHGRPIVLDDEESDALERSGADSEALRAAGSAKPRAPAPAAVKPKPRFRLGGRRSASKTPEPIAIPSSPVESPGASSDAEVQVVGSRDAAGSGGSGAASDVSVEEKRRRRVRGLMVQHAGVPIAEIEQTLVRCQDQLPAALKALAAAGKHESLPSPEDRTDPQGLNSKERRDTYAALDAEFGGRLRKGSEAVMRTLVRHRWSHKASKEYLATLLEVEREESKRRPAPAVPRSTESDSTSRSFPIASSEPDTEDPLDLINTATRKPQKMPMRPAVVLTKQPAAAASSSMSRASSSASASSRVSTAANPREQLREKQKQQHSSRRHADAISVDSNESGSEGDADEDEEDDDDDDSDGSEAGPRESRKHESALNWFNTAAASELMDTINISEAQATTLLSMRPFTSVSDAEERLGDRKAKGVTPRLFTNCIELMAGYNEVDQVLERCERIGRKLMNDMGAWNLGSAHTAASTRESTPALASAADDAAGSSSSSSRASTPGIGSIVGGGGDSKKVVPDLRVTALAREKARKAGFLERQPRNMAKDLVLKDYQLIGVNWLSLLYSHKTSCILADEMGLGKTVQVIAFLANLKLRHEPGPHLVVVPSSVLENWKREFKTFAPSIKYGVYWGSQKEREQLRYDLADDPLLDVIITTYDMAAAGGSMGQLDAKFLKKQRFNVCVFDEGHMLKNRKSERYQKLMRIPVRWRLLLTGTPLQNNLSELVSLLNFILPTYFNDADEALDAIFKLKPGQSQKNLLSQQRVTRAKKMMLPFVLRRKKDKVLRDLSTKTELVEWCEMTPEQEKLYKQVWQSTKAAVSEQNEPAGGRETRGKSKVGRTMAKKPVSSNVLMDLRKAANHPLLFRTYYDEKRIADFAKDFVKEPDHADENLEHVREDFAINSDAQLSMVADSYPFTKKHVLPDDAWLNAGKIKALQRLIPEIKAKGDRLLIFSQFTSVLDILTRALDVMGVTWVGFTGATKVEDRQVIVDEYTNDPSITVFLLSTKAGGLGINLTAANWVVLFDQDFNPQNDKQAMDRSYRMGQKKAVTVVRLISRGTIDQSIYELGTRKLELASRVSGDASASAEDAIEGEADDVVQQEVMTSLMAELRDRDRVADEAPPAPAKDEKKEQEDAKPTAAADDKDAAAPKQEGEEATKEEEGVKKEQPQQASEDKSATEPKKEEEEEAASAA